MLARPIRLLVLGSMLWVIGCGGDHGGQHHDDPFIVESVSATEWHIFRAAGGPFALIAIAVRPLRDAFGAPFLYTLQMVGSAFVDGTDIVFEVRNQLVDQQFVDPLGEEVVDVFITCNCIVTITVGSEDGTRTIPL
jgi:hypothetical protein